MNGRATCTTWASSCSPSAPSGPTSGSRSTCSSGTATSPRRSPTTCAGRAAAGSRCSSLNLVVNWVVPFLVLLPRATKRQADGAGRRVPAAPARPLAGPLPADHARDRRRAARSGPLEVLVPLGYAGVVLRARRARAGPGAARAAGTIPTWRRASHHHAVIASRRVRAMSEGLEIEAVGRSAAACWRVVRRWSTSRRGDRPSCRTASRRRRPTSTQEARFFPPPFEEYWQNDRPSRPVPVLPPADLRRVERLDDGQRLARSGLARGLPPLRPPDLDRRRLRHARRRRTARARARHNPFAHGDECVSRFDLGDAHHDVSRPGSLIDGFCSRCHMPTNYVDNVPLHHVTTDAPSGLEHGRLDANFNPTVGQRHRASRSRPSTRSAATPTRARAASSARSATPWPRRATRRTTTCARAAGAAQPEYTPARPGPRARSCRASGTSSTVPDPARPTSATASAPAASGSRRTPSASRSGWAR